MPKKHQPGCPCCDPCADILTAAEALDFDFTLTGVVADLCTETHCADANDTYLAPYSNTIGASVVWSTTWTTCYFQSGNSATVNCVLDCDDSIKRITVTFLDPNLLGASFRLNTDITGLSEFVGGTAKVLAFSSDNTAGWCDWTGGSITAQLV